MDWNCIDTHSEWAALGDNNVSFADVITLEVLAKRRHALVVFGSKHVTRSSTREGVANTNARIESRFPGATFVVSLNYWGLVTPDAQAKMDSQGQSPPAFYPVKDTSLGAVPDRKGVPLAKQADALLYLGPPARFIIAFPAPGSLEPDQLEEVDRRSVGTITSSRFHWTGGTRH